MTSSTDRARLINAALIAKIHTLEWTATLLARPETEKGVKLNWWGYQGERLIRRFGRFTRSEIAQRHPGVRPLLPRCAVRDHRGVPVAVYRMHPLIPDESQPALGADGHSRRRASRSTRSPARKTRRLIDRHRDGRPLLLVRHQQPRRRRAAQLPEPHARLHPARRHAPRRRHDRHPPRSGTWGAEVQRVPSSLPARPATRFEDFSDDPDGRRGSPPHLRATPTTST